MTISVDLPTERDILLHVINDFSESAMIISLHRLHLLPHFDSVIMLNNGEVIASGYISTLLNNPGPVHNLWQVYKQDYKEHSKTGIITNRK